jgi:hypothetical protein
MKILNLLKKPLALAGASSLIIGSMISLATFAPTSALSLKTAGPVMYLSDQTQATNDACGALSQLNKNQDCDNGAADVGGVLATIVNIISFIAGAIAVIMIVLAGFKFITSGGDANRVASAKNSLIYALIGIVVVALAQAIIHFALNNASQADPCPSNSSIAASSSQCK